MIVHKDEEMVLQHRKSHINLEEVGLYPTVSGTEAVSRNVYPAKSEPPCPSSIDERSTNAPEPMKVFNDTPFKEIQEV